jgi:demethylmenaquinone methyltransferase/2-methoxy-6-polyprenyl-1,4-benzoquinol methylase
MFSAIAPTYDRLNRILSFGIDASWRRAMVSRLPRGPVRVLDLACGTGDVMLEALRLRSEAEVWGADFSVPMLRGAVRKVRREGFRGRVSFQAASAEDLPYRDETFDAVTIAFGIRNVTRRERALGEIWRVLRPGGRALILDFSLPPNAVIAAAYGFYFRRALPLLGGFFSGNYQAYRYLPESVDGFPPRETFAGMMRQEGFEGVTFEDYTLGVATLYRGERR